MAVVERLPRDHWENGHIFAFDREVCTRCGISLDDYEERGKPECPGPTPSPPEAAD
jgi:hypothetical protein